MEPYDSKVSSSKRLIGFGTFGMVYRDEDDDAVACKEFVRTEEFNFETKDKKKKAFYHHLDVGPREEIHTLRIMSRLGVAPKLRSVRFRKTAEEEGWEVCGAEMDRYEADLLRFCMRKENKDIMKRNFNSIARQLIQHVCTWSEIGFVHRDVKANNIVVRRRRASRRTKDDDELELKVIDWGCAQCVRVDPVVNFRDTTYVVREPLGVLQYYSSSKQGEFERAEDGLKVDIWSAAMTLFYVLCHIEEKPIPFPFAEEERGMSRFLIDTLGIDSTVDPIESKVSWVQFNLKRRALNLEVLDEVTEENKAKLSSGAVAYRKRVLDEHEKDPSGRVTAININVNSKTVLQRNNFTKAVVNQLGAVPDYVSPDLLCLLDRMFVAKVSDRISHEEIPRYMKGVPSFKKKMTSADLGKYDPERAHDLRKFTLCVFDFMAAPKDRNGFTEYMTLIAARELYLKDGGPFDINRLLAIHFLMDRSEFEPYCPLETEEDFSLDLPSISEIDNDSIEEYFKPLLERDALFYVHLFDGSHLPLKALDLPLRGCKLAVRYISLLWYTDLAQTRFRKDTTKKAATFFTNAVRCFLRRVWKEEEDGSFDEEHEWLRKRSREVYVMVKNPTLFGTMVANFFRSARGDSSAFCQAVFSYFS